ncbi:MAG: DNA topoisomerase I [Lysobacterales bacterium]
MSKNVLIVESPAKVATISKVLGKDYTVLATYGHVRDLPAKDGMVDTEHDFDMQYQVIDRNAKHVDAIAKAVKKADALWLATDLDREGEAISWHVVQILRERGLLKDKDLHRVVFSEITPKAIRDAVANPRELADALVDAQQARRALDYLVGFNLSPLLWRKVQPGLSAGRVQSPALRMIVEREEEIERFVAREYWTIDAALDKAGHAFPGKLVQLDGSKLDQFDLDSGDKAHAARARIAGAAGLAEGSDQPGQLTVLDVRRSDRQRRPAAPFITSTLQQEASRKLGFGAQRTMRIAQQLYEGIEIDGDRVGLITYMRTDSVNLSNDAITDLRATITQLYGASFLPEKPHRYSTKSKNAQEAHEAIRPSLAERTPAKLKRFLSQDQFRLYELVWKRTLACQMKPALLNTVSVDLSAGIDDLFRASGTTVVDPGFLAVYEEGKDSKDDDDAGRKLPALEKGDVIALNELKAEQHFTEPPPRYSEATLVKALEEYGIGRPSTYASIIQVLLNREYVLLESRRFHPTEVGRVVAKFLSQHFTRYVDYEFTARLEDELDEVARGEERWVPVLERFWQPFKDLIEDKAESVSRQEATAARVIGIDPASGKQVSVRLGRYGPFAQIGTREDEDKPRFASLRPGQKMDALTLEDALELFKLPRNLGQNAAGEEISVAIGRFGPFAKAGKTYASLGKEDDPYSIELARAIELIDAKREAEAKREIAVFDDGKIKVLQGRFGPYITDGEVNARIPKDADPTELTAVDCRRLLAEAPRKPKRGARGKAAAKSKAATTAEAKPKAKAKPKPKAKAKTSAAKRTTTKSATAKKATTGRTATAGSAAKG